MPFEFTVCLSWLTVPSLSHHEENFIFRPSVVIKRPRFIFFVSKLPIGIFTGWLTSLAAVVKKFRVNPKQTGYKAYETGADPEISKGGGESTTRHPQKAGFTPC